jgi:dienelactone hydrolase
VTDGQPIERPGAGLFAIDRYLNCRSAGHPSFFSDGGRVAFISDISGVPQAWQIRRPDEAGRVLWPHQVTFHRERVMGVWCSPQAGDERLIYAMDEGGSENAQLYLLSMDGRAPVRLTRGHEQSLHVFGAWSRDGESFLFSANRRDPALFDLYLQPIEGEAHMLWRNEDHGFLPQMAFSPDGSRVAVNRVTSSFEHALFEVEVETGEVRRLDDEKIRARYQGACYSSDGGALYLLTDMGSDFLQVARLRLEDFELETLMRTEWDAHYLTSSPDGRLLAYALNRGGSFELHAMNPITGETFQAPVAEEPGVIGMRDWVLDFSPDSKCVAFSFTSSTRTKDIYIWEIPENRVFPITESSHGGLPRESFVSPRKIVFSSFDGMEIPAWFYRPRTTGRRDLPAIVYVHGGPAAQFQPYFQFMLQYFLQAGYAVLAPNVRGSTGYGKSYTRLDDVRKRLDAVQDLAHAARWPKGQRGIDAERLIVYGGSYGGFMVLAALAYHPELWAAGVDIVGISNFVTFLENTSDYRRAHREAEYGRLAHDRDFLLEISPTQHVDRIQAPLMVIHGANDPRVPLSEAEQMVQALKEQGTPVRFIVFDDEGHGLVRLHNKRVAYPQVAAFLERYVMGN